MVEVRDDGSGGVDPARGSGLSGLADRVSALGGTLEIESPVGAGTTIRARIPVTAPGDASREAGADVESRTLTREAPTGRLPFVRLIRSSRSGKFTVALKDACPGPRRTSARGCSATAVRFIRGPLALALLCTAVLSGCGGDDNGGTSPASLKNDLIPPSQFSDFTKVARSFESDIRSTSPVEGIALPEATPPSDAVKAMEDASFEAAVGESPVNGKGWCGP